MWDYYSGQILFSLCGHTNIVYALILIDNVTLVSASADKTIKIWNISAGTNNLTLYGHTDQVVDIDLLSNGYLVSFFLLIIASIIGF